MMDKAKQLLITIGLGEEADEEELEKLTWQLQEELTDLDVGKVELAKKGEVPEHAKTGEPIAWGQLLLTIASGGVLVRLISALQFWLTREERRSLTLKIGDEILEVKGISSKEQQQLIKVWVNRHMGVSAND